jgi:hypothetical protein
LCGSSQHKALHFKRLTQIDQKAYAQPGRFQVVETLGAVNVVQFFDCFQFDDHCAVHHKVGGVLANDHAIISDDNTALLLDGKARLTQFVRQRVLIYLFDKARSQRIRDRECTSDDPLRDSGEPAIICSSVFVCGFKLFLRFSRQYLAKSLPPTRRTVTYGSPG